VTGRVCEKIAQNVPQTQFFAQAYPWNKVGSPSMWDTCAIFKPMPKVNNRPIVENSPNLVTLISVPLATII
jgi:hypothetical protein